MQVGGNGGDGGKGGDGRNGGGGNTELLGAAQAADEILRRVMPKATGVRSYAQVAKACRCSSRTPRSWLLWDGEIVVPDEPGRSRLAALVEDTVGDGARVSLQSAWAKLLNGQRLGAESQMVLDRGAAASDASKAAAVAKIGVTKTPLSLDDRQLIIEQATLILEEAYAHLPFKEALHAVNPVQRLKIFNYRISQQHEGDQDEVSFHREMIDIFTSLRDLHTSYVVPKAYQRAVVLLPFRVEEYFEKTDDGGHRPTYVASKVNDQGAAASGFVEGVQITHWNGVPIHRAIELLAERQAAGNEPAAFARALDALTLRPMLSSMVPDEKWVNVTFIDGAGAEGEVRFTWTPQDAPAELLGDHIGVALGIDAQTHAVSAVRKELYGRKNQAWTQAAEERGLLRTPIALKDHHLETKMPWSFRAHKTLEDKYGYIRIFSFDTRRPAEFVTEFARLTTELPVDGLIIDLRGNAGGSIVAAEGVLQVLVAEAIRPLRAQFTTSPLLLDICKRNATPTRKIPLELAPWIGSLSQAVATGSSYSRGFPITSQASLDAITVRYRGPVVLIVDALCYSATDMFAAGFADHEVGPIIGTSDNTGAGGANVWRHSDLLKLAGPKSDLESLPGGIDFRVAVRRTTRVHEHEGEILEDLGIEVTDRYYMSRNDVFEGNRDLIAAAGDRLAGLGGDVPGDRN